MKSRDLFAFLMLAFGPGWLPGQTTPVTFLEPRTFGTGWGQSIALADFNRDGAMDAATVGTGITVYLGDGHGSFTAKPAIGLSGTAIVAADFNGDGAPDLAIASTTDLIVLLGNGDGTFRAPLVYPGAFAVLTVADFNGDGILDIAVGTTASQVQIFFGAQGGGFQPGPLTTLPTGNAVSIVSADFNGDGKADLAVTGVSSSVKGVAVLLGNGNGTFAAPATYPVAEAVTLPALVTADFNGDRAPDLVYAVSTRISYSVGILLNQGKGIFSAGATIQTQADINALAAADLNGDGIPDLVAGGSGLALIFLGKSDGTFQRFEQFVLDARALAIADFNGDGVPDVASVSGNQYGTGPPLSLMLGAGKGTFYSSRAFDAGPQPNGLAVGDFNQDGILDLAVAQLTEVSPSIAVLLGDGKGHFGRPVNYLANDPTAVAVSDVNRDGKLDVVFVGHNSVGTLPGKGDGTFGPAIYSPCPRCEGPLLVGDFNGDGIPDLLTSQDTNEVIYLAILLGKGDGTFRPPADILAQGYPSSFAAADFNNDGILDLLVSISGTYILMGNGDGTFGPAVLLSSDQSLGAVGDFNGDGNVDIALSDGAIYLGNGNGTFTPAFVVKAPGSPALAGDFNGDGVLDLLGVDRLSGLGFVLLGKGNGDFVLQQREFMTSGVTVSGDFNGDGKLDLAMSGYRSPVWILLNTTSP